MEVVLKVFYLDITKIMLLCVSNVTARYVNVIVNVGV